MEVSTLRSRLDKIRRGCNDAWSSGQRNAILTAAAPLQGSWEKQYKNHLIWRLSPVLTVDFRETYMEGCLWRDVYGVISSVCVLKTYESRRENPTSVAPDYMKPLF